MPKDLIHFTIAERTAALLSDTRYADRLDKARPALLLGSVFHDALFYAVTPNATPLENLAHVLHGAKGQDTFTLVRLQANHAAREHSPVATALLVGIISHLYADAVMHPLVWHLTGDYYADDKAARSRTRQRHRALESLMDMTACPDKLGDSNYALRRQLRILGERLTTGIPLTELAELAGMEPRTAARGLKTSWQIYAVMQTAYTCRPLAWALGALHPFLLDGLAEIAALFYTPQLMPQAPSLQGSIEYKHPVTGKKHSSSLNDLMEQAAQQAATLCRSLEPAVFEDTPVDLDTGPSMDAGMPSTPTDAMHHFASPPFPRLG